MSAFVDMRGGERRAALGALFTLLAITAGHMLLETARDALFLARLPPTQLPWVYLGIAAIGVVLARVNARLSRASGGAGHNRLTFALLVSGAVTFGFWGALAIPTGTGLGAKLGAATLYALYLWSGLFASMVVVQFWLLLGSTYTVAQAKRLYGFIGAGSILGAVLGSAGARGLAAIVHTRHLLLGAAVLFVAAGLGPALLVSPSASTKPSDGVPPPAPSSSVLLDDRGNAKGAGDLRLVTSDPFTKRIFGLVILSTIALTIVDFLFKRAVALEIAPDKLGSFFATVNICLNVLALIAQVFGVGWLFRKVGVHRALWVMPCLLLLGSGYVAVGSVLLPALLLKGADGMFRHSLHKTSTELLYVPIPEAIRTRAKPFIDAVGQRGGQAVASMAILLATVVFHGESRTLAILVGLLSVAWIVVAAGIRKPYLDLFRTTLREGKVDMKGKLPPLNREALEALFAALSSSKVPEVLAAMDMLAAYDRERLVPPLILYHPSRAVVLRALEIFADQKRTDFLPIATWLDSHEDAEVRSAALRARASVDAREEGLRAYLTDPAPEMQATALVGLAARGWLEKGAAQEALEQKAKDPTPQVRIALARAIHEEPLPMFEDVLLGMAAAESMPAAQSQIARAMGRLGSPRFLPALRDMLSSRQAAASARAALVQMGDPSLVYLESSLDDASLTSATRASLPRAISMFPPAVAARILLDRLTREPDGMVRFRVLRALCRLREDDPQLVLRQDTLTRFADEALRSAFRNLDWRVSLTRAGEEAPERKTRAFQLLATLLKDKEAHATSRLFRALDLLHPGERFLRIQRGLQSKRPKTRASSRELIENLVAPLLRPPLLILVDDLPDEGKLMRASSFYVRAQLGYEDLLREMMSRGGELEVLVAYHVKERGLSLAVSAPDKRTTKSAFSAGVARALEKLSPVTNAR